LIEGAILVGGEARQRETKFAAINPSLNQPVGPPFSEAHGQDVADACVLAASAYEEFAGLAPARRAQFLELVAERITGIGDVLIETAMAESGLPRARLEGERGRTVGQLRLFAEVVRAGAWLDAVIDPALPMRTPAPRADLRRMNIALGPVAVFGASNFPLAFSVAGGDTASALAAGCPVIVKGHPAHPGTGELVARAIQAAVRAFDLPAGVFSYLPGATRELGATLVSDARVKAAAFTGSRAGGLALQAIAARRAEPIPVYAEMSSINPVVLMPAALSARAEVLGAAFVTSLTLGAGQFCTNPGLVIAIDGPDLDRFVAAASAALSQSDAAVMLTPGISMSYGKGVATLESHTGARRLAKGKLSDEPNRGVGALFETSADAFLNNSSLAEEVFGASSLIVRCQDMSDMARVIEALEGQLTATIHLDQADTRAAARLLPLLRDKVGRVLANGWPTGVEVTHAMVHGGPFPATTDGRTTSVGSLAMMRFLRPVCYQDVPDELLPEPLKAANPWRVPRRIDGRLEVA
jgi:alpha-ketoglutaric semialdehyde dehydrogenase